MNQDAINIPELDWMIFTETHSHATVEEWTEAKCRVQDFVSHEETGEVYSFWQRAKVAEFTFDPSGKDRHLLNKFFLDNGVKLKEGTKVLTDGPAMPEEKDKYEFESI